MRAPQQSLRLFPFAILATLALAGCETLKPGVERANAFLHFYKGGQKVDTGVVDYRYFDTATGKFTYHFAPRECIRKADTPPPTGGPQCEEGIINPDDVLRGGDSISVNLLYGFVCDFYETANTPRELSRNFGSGTAGEVRLCHDSPENRAGTRGEIAIMASIFELGGERKISFQADTIGDKSARMIYYSEDVRESGQSLNLSNLPMYGPVSYSGKPVYLSLFVIEIDGPEVAATGSILRKLADLGAKAYPPSSPVLGALSKVGDSFLQSQQDDSIVDYRMVFDGPEGRSPRTAPLAAGLYVFTRMQNRSLDFDWKTHCLDASTGKIYKLKGQASATCNETTGDPFASETYFTIQIKRNEPALEQDVYQTFQEFSALDQEKASELNGLSKSLDALQVSVSRAAIFDRARAAIAHLGSPLSTQRRQAQEALMDGLCLGVGDGESEDASSQGSLSDEQVFYLLRQAEIAGALKDPGAAKDQYQGTCNTRQTEWSGAEALFAAPEPPPT